MTILDEQSFSKEVETKQGVFLVDFYTTWCGPCKMLAPVLEEVAKETSATVYKFDIETSETISRKFGIMVVPTMIIFKDGVEVEKFTGYMQKEEILEKLEKYTNN